MAELLDPRSQNVEYVPVEAQERPVAQPKRRQQPAGVDRLRPQPPPNPFVTRTGPPLLLLPHDPSGGQQQPQPDEQAQPPQPAEPPQPRLQQPVQQRRGGPVRCAVPYGADPFFRAAVENPDDLAVRGALADWLEEQGDPRHLVVRGHDPSLDEVFGHSHWYVPTIHGDGRNMEDGDWIDFNQHPATGTVDVKWWPGIGGNAEADKDPRWIARLRPADALAIAEHIGHADQMPWLREMAARAPERMGRRAVRFAAGDVAALHASVAEAPEDDARWGILADALDEAGKPHGAALMRKLGGGPFTKARPHGYRQHSDSETRDGVPSLFVRGHLTDIPITLAPRTNGTGWFSLWSPEGRHTWLGTGTLEAGHTAGLLHEIEPDAQTAGAHEQLKQMFPAAGPERFAAAQAPPRKVVRMADENDEAEDAALVRQWYEYLADRPSDRGRWAGLADALSSAGRLNVASMVRRIGEVGEWHEPSGAMVGPGRLLDDPALASHTHMRAMGLPLTIHESADQSRAVFRLAAPAPGGYPAFLGAIDHKDIRGADPSFARRASPRTAEPWGDIRSDPGSKHQSGSAIHHDPPGYKGPERFAAQQAGPMGELFRGSMYTAGQFTPAPMPAPPPAAPAPRKRTRLRELLRRPSMKMARLDDAFVRGMADAPAEDLDPWGRFADHLEEQGMGHLARAVRGERTPENYALFNPDGPSHFYPPHLDGRAFPAYAPDGGKVLTAMLYYPEHGVAALGVSPFIDRLGNGAGFVVRGHEAVRDLADEIARHNREANTENGSWAAGDDEREGRMHAIRDEAARRAGGAT